jgi:regulator of protease activity HflC (stomatin/prohibitin superfamily)
MTDHHHHHDQKCCSAGHSQQDERILDEQLDAAGQSLRRALKTSFWILKFVIVVLLAFFIFSGVFQVQQDEEAIRLHFGDIKGDVLKPGIHFAWPEPIDEIVRIPVQRELSIPIDSFWYFETEQEKLNPVKRPVTGPLDPLKDGYCLTRNDLEGMAGMDYNIVHSAWTITYKISSPKLFFENVYIREGKPGEDLLEASADTLNPLIESLASNAIVRTMVKYSIDEAIKSEFGINNSVKAILQKKLDRVQSGIQVSEVRSRIVWPRQVEEAFQASTKARQEKDQARTDASSYKDKLLTDTGGANAEEILEQLKQPGLSQDEKEQLVAKLSGQVQAEIVGARAYRTKVVEDAKANAEYLQKLLPQYRKNPELVLQDIYQDAIKRIMANADEKIFMQTREGVADEIRILLNRDPNIKKEASKKKQ